MKTTTNGSKLGGGREAHGEIFGGLLRQKAKRHGK